MKNHSNGNSIKRFIYITLTTFILITQSCIPDKKDVITKEESEVVDIITVAMEFQMPDTIPSGWNTFRYDNRSNQTHFFLVDKFPEGKSLGDMKTYVTPVFDSGMKLINEGKRDEGFAEFAKLPEWFSQVSYVGGTGLISAETIGETTIKLDPGYYIVECYVKMNTGVFHSSLGMSKELVVSEYDSGNQEPVADVSIQISSTEGITFNDSIKSGMTIFSVYFVDQIAHENFVGHDISLARIDEQTNLDFLNQWMNWADPNGLIEPAPNGVTFLGGVNNMPTGSKGYFTVSLEPGEYVLISEIPDPLAKNMMVKFTAFDRE